MNLRKVVSGCVCTCLIRCSFPTEFQMMTHLYTYRCRSHEETTENKKVAGLLGVLMRCCVYLGIDETLTRDRVRYLLTEAEVQEVLVAGSAFDLPLCKTVDILGLPEERVEFILNDCNVTSHILRVLQNVTRNWVHTHHCFTE